MNFLIHFNVILSYVSVDLRYSFISYFPSFFPFLFLSFLFDLFNSIVYIEPRGWIKNRSWPTSANYHVTALEKFSKSVTFSVVRADLQAEIRTPDVSDTKEKTVCSSLLLASIGRVRGKLSAAKLLFRI